MTPPRSTRTRPGSAPSRAQLGWGARVVVVERVHITDVDPLVASPSRRLRERLRSGAIRYERHEPEKTLLHCVVRGDGVRVQRRSVAVGRRGSGDCSKAASNGLGRAPAARLRARRAPLPTLRRSDANPVRHHGARRGATNPGVGRHAFAGSAAGRAHRSVGPLRGPTRNLEMPPGRAAFSPA